jgi:hypothetical protein
VIRIGTDRRFVTGDQVASLHERGADLRISAADAADLPTPHGGAPVWRDAEPGVRPSHWRHLVDLISGKDPRGRDWADEN